MKKVYILIFLLLCLPIMKTEAFYCPYAESARLKKLAANINSSYDFVEANNQVTFSITLVNLQPELYIVDVVNNQTYYYTGSELVINGFKSGSVQFKVYTNTQYCEEELLATIRINLPTYNAFYTDKVCENLSDYELCQRWSSHGLSYENFVKKVNEYKHKPPIEEKPDIKDEYVSIWDILLDYWSKYYYIPLSLIIVGSGIGIYVSNKKSNIYR